MATRKEIRASRIHRAVRAWRPVDELFTHELEAIVNEARAQGNMLAWTSREKSAAIELERRLS